jgi:lysine-specific demethylase 3
VTHRYLDRCLTSIFATSFLCTFCGREFCIDCYSSLHGLDPEHPSAAHLDSFTTCGGLKRSGRRHEPAHFLPVSRIELKVLESSIQEMDAILCAHDRLSGDRSSLLQNTTSPENVPQQHQTTASNSRTEAIQSVLPFLQGFDDDYDSIWGSDLTSLESDSEQMVQPLGGDVRPRPLSGPEGANIQKMDIFPRATVVESLPFETFHHSELSDEKFRSLWSEGKTLVVKDLLAKMNGNWTPQYFIEQHGSEICSITNCDDESQTKSNVAEFFQKFGRYDNRDKQILKLKDWPPTADFKTTFPSLFDDFERVVPAPEYTRRDGFYNISAHFPMDTVAPDMGPKMYNALASREDGKGSTRLHMDMVGITLVLCSIIAFQSRLILECSQADAVNIMLYSEAIPGGQEGSAVWDIYPSGASDLIRTFLKEEFPVSASAVSYIDPIHSQYFYLTPALRQKLLNKYGVKAWRIYQNPGDAVFIPAGCAHQVGILFIGSITNTNGLAKVCNLADCIKVAVDFVSPENLARCAQLTKEFRNENERVAWKEDILQLQVAS